LPTSKNGQFDSVSSFRPQHGGTKKTRNLPEFGKNFLMKMVHVGQLFFLFCETSPLTNDHIFRLTRPKSASARVTGDVRMLSNVGIRTARGSLHRLVRPRNRSIQTQKRVA